MRRRQRSSLLSLIPLFIILPWWTYHKHYDLPDPIEAQYDAEGLPQISEKAVLRHAFHLSEGIGYRTVGSKEHALADAWMLDQANHLARDCNKLARKEKRKLECEVWRQEGDGAHRFDMMDKRVYKSYVKLSNIIVRVSNGTPAGKEHAVLVNAHVDSTLPSPGAADDAIPVGIMIEAIRVLTRTPGWSPDNAIIFLFNNAEESLQDGSQLYSTQHETAKSVRAVINLEAAGTTGPELLFQATSAEMIKAYSHVPRPYGTVMANDIFSSGIIMSDTDFRQFQYYLNVTGLDMAVVGNSYFYHTRKDLVENFEPGAAQHMAENTMALLKYLSSSESPIPTLTTYSPPRTVFYSIYGTFFVMYSFETAAKLHFTLLCLSVAFIGLTTHLSQWKTYVKAGLGVGGGFIGAVLSANTVALIMGPLGISKNMSWFTREWYCGLLYGPPALIGILTSQLLFSAPRVNETMEHASLIGLLGFFLTLLFTAQYFDLGSANVPFIFGIGALSALLVNTVVQSFASAAPAAKDDKKKPKKKSVKFDGIPDEADDWKTRVAQVDSLLVYAVGQIPSLVFGPEIFFALTDVFVPLTGRMGGDTPVDHIIATLVAVVSFMTVPFFIPLAHRFGRGTLKGAILALALLSIVSITFFSRLNPFDPEHPKRIFVLHVENMTSSEHHLHLAAADAAPGFETLVQEIAGEFGLARAELETEELNNDPLDVVMNEYNPDWDALYPFSQFLSPFKIPVAIPEDYVSPWANSDRFTIVASSSQVDLVGGTRTLRITIKHPEIIWPVIAFDAQVLKWSLDDNPLPEYTRHHIKGASFYGVDALHLDLTIALQPGDTKGELEISFSGLLEKGMYPHKKKDGMHLPGMQLFEQLDQWLIEKTADSVDTMLLSSVAGKVVV